MGIQHINRVEQQYINYSNIYIDGCILSWYIFIVVLFIFILVVTFGHNYDSYVYKPEYCLVRSMIVLSILYAAAQSYIYSGACYIICSSVHLNHAHISRKCIEQSLINTL